MNQLSSSPEPILKLLYDRRKLVTLYILLGLLGAVAVNITALKTYKGSFTIVLNQDNAKKDVYANLRGSFGSLLSSSLPSGDAEMATTIEVLKSYSVLKPIYQYAKETSKMSTKFPSFSRWKRGFSFSKTKGADILKITYVSTDRSDITDVLTKAEDVIQEFSIGEERESTRKAIAFTTAQISKYSDIYESLQRKLDRMSLRYGIAYTQSNGPLSSSFPNLSQSNLDVSQGLSLSQLSNAGGISPAKSPTQYQDEINELTKEIIRRKQIFKENDPSIISLNRQIKALARYNELTANGGVGLPEVAKEDGRNSQDLYLDFINLQRNVDRISSLLSTLRQTQLSLEISQSKQLDPWETISPVQVSTIPISPRPILNLVVGVLLGLSVSILHLFVQHKYLPSIGKTRENISQSF